MRRRKEGGDRERRNRTRERVTENLLSRVCVDREIVCVATHGLKRGFAMNKMKELIE